MKSKVKKLIENIPQKRDIINRVTKMIKNTTIIIGVLTVVAFFFGTTPLLIQNGYSTLDFYGSLGFDMFDKRPFEDDSYNYNYNHNYNHEYEDDDNNNYNHHEYELTVRIVAGKYNMPDFKIKAGSYSTVAYGNEFEDDSKAKVRLHVDDSIKKVCISTVNSNYHFKQCKPITSDEITFHLTPKN